LVRREERKKENVQMMKKLNVQTKYAKRRRKPDKNAWMT